MKSVFALFSELRIGVVGKRIIPVFSEPRIDLDFYGDFLFSEYLELCWNFFLELLRN